MDRVAGLLGRPYSDLRPRGARPKTRARPRFSHPQPALFALETGRRRDFAVQVHGLGDKPTPGRGQPGHTPLAGPGRRQRRARAAGDPLPRMARRPWARGAYGKIIRVELLHKLHDELKYDSLESLKTGIAKDCDEARAFFAQARSRFQPPCTRKPAARPRATEFRRSRRLWPRPAPTADGFPPHRIAGGPAFPGRPNKSIPCPRPKPITAAP